MLLGGHACGALLQGWLAEQLGVRQGLATTGALALLATAAVGLALLQTRHGTDPLGHDVPTTEGTLTR
jgi:hypothetical protein